MEETVTDNSRNAQLQRIASELRVSIRKAAIRRAPNTLAGVEEDGIGPINGAGRARVSLPGPGIERDGALAHDLATLRSTYDIAGAPFTSHRRILGRFIIVIKDFARELLVQLLARQSVYNGAATRAIVHLKDRLDAIAAEQARMARRLAAIESRIGAAPPASEARPARPSGAGARTEALELRRLNERLTALENAVAGRRRRV
jgi:hypothetical protein